MRTVLWLGLALVSVLIAGSGCSQRRPRFPNGWGTAPSVAAGFRERELVTTRDELGDDNFAAAWAEGLARGEDEALDVARAAVVA